MREIAPTWDGSGGIYRFPIRDGAGIRDLASATCEIYLVDDDGVSWGMRPGVIIGAKSEGTVDLQFRGREVDWDGLPKGLWAIPMIYYATAPDRTPATNLLLNPSFDAATGTNPNRIADNWVLAGAAGSIFDNYANDTGPPVIYANGTFQLVGTPGTGYLHQNVSQSPALGEVYSFGCWARGDGINGVADDGNSIILETIGGTYEYATARMPVGSFDWLFMNKSLTIAKASHTTLSLGLLVVSPYHTVGSWRFDEAFLFKGYWNVFCADAMRIPVQPRRRIPKASNQLAGYGSFEVDSNADGVADGWSKQGTGGTFTIDKDPANVYVGMSSQKVALTDQSNVFMRFMHRGRFKVGDIWKASVRMKTAGILLTGSGTGGFLIRIRTDNFDSTLNITDTNFGTNVASFTEYAALVAITEAERSVLRVEIWLNGYTGALWLDDVQLVRTVAGP